MPFFTVEQLYPYLADNPGARDRYVGLVSCGKTKRLGTHEARKLYIGRYARTCIEWIERNCSHYRILSAKHRVLFPSSRIRCYEKSMDSMTKVERKDWGKRVSDRLLEQFGAQTLFLSLAGRTYLEHLYLPNVVNVWEKYEQFSMGARASWLIKNPVLDETLLAKITKGER